MTNDMLDFWGKTSSDTTGERKRHPLVWHSLDVAAVAELLLDVFPSPVDELCKSSTLDAFCVRSLLVRLILLHDVGKFAIGFQAKAPDFFPICLGPFPADLPLGDHTAIGLRMLLIDFAQELDTFAPGVDPDARRPLLEAICAHHGRPLIDAQ